MAIVLISKISIELLLRIMLLLGMKLFLLMLLMVTKLLGLLGKKGKDDDDDKFEVSHVGDCVCGNRPVEV